MSLEHGGELPAEVDRVLDGGVIAEAPGRREEMRGIAAEEDPAADSNIAFASRSVIRVGFSSSRSWVWKANSPFPSTAAMKARRCRFKVTFIQAGACGTTS